MSHKVNVNRLKEELKEASYPENPYAIPVRQRRAGAHKDKDEKRTKNKEQKFMREWDED
jgi:hypothetical protein